MHHSSPVAARLVRDLQFHRWVIPAILSALGTGYTYWENILVDGYPIFSRETITGVGLLGILGPVLAWGVLTWARAGAETWVRAEQVREQQQRHLRALNSISEAVNQTLELEAVLDRAMDCVLQVMHLESGEVRLIENNQLVLHCARGVSANFISAERTHPLGLCACGLAAAHGELVAIEDLDRLPAYADTACHREQFRSVLSVPVRTASRIVGAIHVATRAPRGFDESDRALLTAMGHQVGVAIEKAQLHAQLKTLNQELESRVAERTRELSAAQEESARHAQALGKLLTEERRVEEKTRARIAHDLHDGVQQLMVGALYEMQAAREALERDPQIAAARIDASQQLIRQMETEMRHAVLSLRPMLLDAQGLAPAVRECIRGVENISRIKCDLRIDGKPRPLDGEIQIAAFRIIQEALNNIEAHSQARRAQVCLHFDSSVLRVEIADDGKGFDPERQNESSKTRLGLIGMRERAASIAGTLEVWSRVGEGTRVKLLIPIEKADVQPYCIVRDPFHGIRITQSGGD